MIFIRLSFMLIMLGTAFIIATCAPEPAYSQENRLRASIVGNNCFIMLSDDTSVNVSNINYIELFNEDKSEFRMSVGNNNMRFITVTNLDGNMLNLKGFIRELNRKCNIKRSY